MQQVENVQVPQKSIIELKATRNAYIAMNLICLLLIGAVVFLKVSMDLTPCFILIGVAGVVLNLTYYYYQYRFFNLVLVILFVLLIALCCVKLLMPNLFAFLSGMLM